MATRFIGEVELGYSDVVNAYSLPTRPARPPDSSASQASDTTSLVVVAMMAVP